MPIAKEQIDPKIYEHEIEELKQELKAEVQENDCLRDQLRRAKEIIYQMTAEKYAGRI